MPAADRLDYLYASRVRGCRRCKLHRNRNQAVFGVGNPEARLVLVGEGPGADENREGEPFVGPAGQILTGMCRRCDLDRAKDLYICNVVKCWPGPGNPDPEPEDVAACAPYLHLQLRVIRPRVIVALGRVAAVFLTGRTDNGVGALRKLDLWYENEVTGLSCPVLVSYHPSYILRNTKTDTAKAKEAARALQEDLQRAIELSR